MKIKIKRKTNELYALKPPGSKRKHYNIVSESSDIHIEAIRDIGFGNIEYISKGLYGSVYRGTWDEYDGVEHAIKVMTANTGKEEARIYKTISDARKNNKLIAKHFPRVDMTRFDKKRNLVLIVMEILEDDPSAKSVIQDIFGQGEVGRFRPDLALDDMDVQKNIGKRANLMITDEKTKEMVLDKMLYFAPNRQEEIKRNMMNINFRGVKRQPKIYKTVNRQYKTDSKMFQLIDVLMDDLMYKDSGKLMGAEAYNFAIRFIYECMKAWEKDFDEGFEKLFKEIEPAIEDFINLYRQWTPVGISPKGSGFLQGAPPETQGAGYPGAKSILKAIDELKRVTALQATDLHDQNVLIRPQTKEIVIVDVGMFKQGNKWRDSRYSSAVTALGEEIWSSFENIVEEELEAVLERCQKGYKTHPTRKTKKMFGKSYRNCVKAEAQEEFPEKVHKKAAYIQDKEGKDRDQAYAIAISMYEKGDLNEADPKKGTGKKPKGSGRRLYTDEDPSDTVSVSFKSVSAIQKTLSKKSFKAKSHKRQSQIINLIHQRARAAYQNAKDPDTKARLKKAYEYAKKRKEASKRKTIRLRKKK